MNNPRFEKVLLETGEAHRFPGRGGRLVLVREWRFTPGRIEEVALLSGIRGRWTLSQGIETGLGLYLRRISKKGLPWLVSADIEPSCLMLSINLCVRCSIFQLSPNL